MQARQDGRGMTKVVAMLAVAAMAIAGCGDSDDDEGDAAPAAESTTTVADDTTTTSEAAVEGDVVAFCDALVAIDSDTGPDIDFETATDEEQAEAIQEYSAIFEPKLQAAEDNAPTEVEDAVATAAGLFREGLSTGDDSFFESEEFAQANATIDSSPSPAVASRRCP